MRLIENESIYRTIWSRFPFSGFDDRQKTLIPFWEKWSLEVLRLLGEGKNVGIIADTGAGKTIIAHLVATARYNKVLFLVPERILGQQHERLLESMAGAGSYATQVLIGSTPHKKRFWNPDAQFTFATPQTFVADFNRWKFEMDFDFVVFDELHHGTGEYDYTKIAVVCKALNIPVVGLSASPGKNVPEIEKIAETMGFDTFCHVPDPNREKKRFVYPKIIPMNEPLRRIEEYLSRDIAYVVRKICEERLYPSRGKELFIPERDLEKIEERLERLVPSRLKYHGLFLLGAYRKLHAIMHFALVESYGTALAYWDGKLGADTSKSGKFVRGLRGTDQAISLMRTLDEKDHPKVERLLYLARSGYIPSVRGIVFVNNRNTGQILTRLLNENGWNADLITGGMSIKRQTGLLRKLADGTMRFIVSTSAIEEGVSVPEIGCVIQYSMPLSEKPRIQRSGRTARVNYGAVDYIILDHPMDKIPFFVSAQGEKTMKEIVSNYPKYKARMVTGKSRAETQLFLFS